MLKSFYAIIRLLHLHTGLFISPFVFMFCISVLVLNHPELFHAFDMEREALNTKVKLEKIKLNEDKLVTAKEIVKHLKISGEIDWISQTDSTISFPVHQPGRSYEVFVNLKVGEASIRTIHKGSMDGMAYLHMMPGPHNAMLRGNSFFMKAWKVTTDSVVYLILFVTSSGTILWYFLKQERRWGWVSMSAGLIIFSILMLLLL